MTAFAGSPNVLFAARVLAVGVLSPGFRRIVLGGPALSRFAPHGRDQRIKLLVPPDDGYPAVLEPGLVEHEWRARLRALPAQIRPVMRSYTPAAVRPDRGEVDLDVFGHARPGPASAWAAAARPGDAVLLSGPDARRGNPDHGVQWPPGRPPSC
ncbi:siderophore-interacting protein [Pseudonocardia sp. ICBG1293]|uniref:siderophore-interacting protein n=1 Tax=Pseudonocardia sp. ICBG1293 TaxID=2844382 RepID=UPI001CCE65E4|nr:siderophore-interacting protein [Pseudonocardia sp. ICBG1293]